MGLTCSKCVVLDDAPVKQSTRQDSPDPFMYDLTQKSVAYSQSNDALNGQHHLLFHKQHHSNKGHHGKGSSGANNSHNNKSSSSSHKQQQPPLAKQHKTDYPTRLVLRRHLPRHYEEGASGSHIYCVRYPADLALDMKGRELAAVEAAPQRRVPAVVPSPTPAASSSTTARVSSSTADPNKNADSSLEEDVNVDHLFRPSTMGLSPERTIVDWVTVSDEHKIFVADTGLTVAECDEIVRLTEQVCRGQYAAYTYAKQTLGCREFPVLAHAVQGAVHTITHAIVSRSTNHKMTLALDDREPHMVKYDVSKRERQKLDMHTDKSEWTFLIALSNPCGVDYEGGGTYFECLDSTLHLQRGHALIFPGKLRHCGQRITSGLRFLLVGFLVDKSTKVESSTSSSQPDHPNPTNIP